MKLLETIIKNPVLILIIMLKDLIDISKRLLKTPGTSTEIDWWDFCIKLAIAIALWYVIRKFFELRDEIKALKKKVEFEASALAVLTYVKGKRSFLKAYQIFEFQRLPDETEEHFWNRLPNGGLLKKELRDEFEEARMVIINNWKDKTANEIENFLKPLYPDYIFK